MIFNIDVKNSFSFFETENKHMDDFLNLNKAGIEFNARPVSFEVSKAKSGGYGENVHSVADLVKTGNVNLLVAENADLSVEIVKVANVNHLVVENANHMEAVAAKVENVSHMAAENANHTVEAKETLTVNQPEKNHLVVAVKAENAKVVFLNK